MGKVIVWIVVVFVVLFALRLLNASKARRRRDAAAAGRSAPRQEAMVRCARCGTFLPRAEAKAGPEGLTCGDPKCTQRR
jgi:uncharacterized protein